MLLSRAHVRFSNSSQGVVHVRKGENFANFLLHAVRGQRYVAVADRVAVELADVHAVDVTGTACGGP